MWVLDYLDDLDADFRAIYGIQDFMTLPGPRFFKLACRVTAYEGCMAARVAQQRSSPSSSSSSSGQVKTVGSTRAELMTAFPGEFEIAKAGK